MDTDYHIHTASTDGPPLENIRQAARAEQLQEIGLVDHCNVSPYNNIGYKADMFDVDSTNQVDQSYFSKDAETRRESVDELIQDHDAIYRPENVPETPLPEEYGGGNENNLWNLLEPSERPLIVWLGVEMDYEPELDGIIDVYLGERDFDYSIGSVHYLDDTYVPKEDRFPEMSASTAEEYTEEYFDKMVSLVDSEIFDILAHPGLIERNPMFEPFVTESHYEEVAEALKSSSTVTEINGKSLERQEPPYPVDIMHDVGVESFTLGTDTHRPEEIGNRNPLVSDKLEELEVESVKLDQLTEGEESKPVGTIRVT